MMRNKFSIVLIIAPVFLFLFLSGCLTKSINIKKGKELLTVGNYDEAVEYFKIALKEDPNSVEIRVFLYRAKLNSYYYHLLLARKYKDLKRRDMAIKEYKIALGIFPLNIKLMNEFDSYVNKKKVKKKEFKSTIKPPIILKIDIGQKVSLNIKSGTPITKIFKILGKSYNVSFIFDKDFRDFPYSIEIEDIGFYEVLNQLCMIANARYRIVDRSSILIYPNQTFKRRTFDLRGVKIFYLINIKPEDAKRLLMNVFRDQQIMVQEDKTLNCVIVKASINALMEVEKFIKSIDKERSEVELDVEIFEINRNIISRIGADFGSILSTISSGKLKDDGTINPLVDMSKLKDTNFLITLPSIALNLLGTTDKNKIIAKPNLRGIDGEEIHFMVGDEIPVPQTQFGAYAAGGVTTVPQTSFGYKKVGVDIKLTPTIHGNNEVTIKIKLSIDFVTAYVDQKFPVLGKRELENIIRLKEGETSIIGGFIRDEIRGSLNGIPGLSRIPILGRLFGSSEETIRQTDLFFSITPRIIRKVDLTERDTETIWTNSRTSSRSFSEPRTVSPDQGPGREDPRARGRIQRNTIVISPSRRRVPVNKTSFFTIRISSNSNITSLAVSGSVSGGKASIDELNTNFFKSDKVKIMKNTSGNSFDIGYSFLDGPVKNNILAQLKVKFNEKGEYYIKINNATAYTKDRKNVEINTTTARIDVY